MVKKLQEDCQLFQGPFKRTVLVLPELFKILFSPLDSLDKIQIVKRYKSVGLFLQRSLLSARKRIQKTGSWGLCSKGSLKKRVQRSSKLCRPSKVHVGRALLPPKSLLSEFKARTIPGILEKNGETRKWCQSHSYHYKHPLCSLCFPYATHSTYNGRLIST